MASKEVLEQKEASFGKEEGTLYRVLFVSDDGHEEVQEYFGSDESVVDAAFVHFVQSREAIQAEEAPIFFSPQKPNKTEAAAQ